MTNRLIKGFIERFRPTAYEGEKAVMPELVSYGQKPEYFIISCADSRSDPGVIFDAQSGEFFGFKAIGAIVRPYKTGTALAASLQFAINYLKVSKIVLLGHTQCGAIKALHDDIEDPEIASFIDVAHDAMDKARKIAAQSGETEGEEDLLRLAEQQVLLASAENLKSYPPVRDALKEGRVTIENWIFDMEHGHILKHDTQSGKFIVADADPKIVSKKSCC